MRSFDDEFSEIYRREVGRCTATLIRVLGDVDLAEDAVAEAFAIASERWRRDGLPPNPGGWITTTARNRALDRIRREASRKDKQRAAERLSEQFVADPDPELDDLDAMADTVADDQLRLLFLCCHPALAPDAQVALTLRLLGGLEVPDIARVFVAPDATIAQRIVRAKRKLRDNNAGYRIPGPEELPDRLPIVLATISAIYTEGHRHPSEVDAEAAAARTELVNRATHLARSLVTLMPDEPEAVGLLALLLLTEARRPARLGASGELVRLSDQDRSLWDRSLIAEGHHLVRACLRRDRPGPFQLQAAIAAVHADAPSWDTTAWEQIVALYDQLLAFRPDAVVRLNRAAAIAELHGPDVALAAIDDATRERLDRYQPLHATLADLAARSGLIDDALAAYDRALALTTDPAEATFLRKHRAALPEHRAATAGPDDKTG